MLIATPLPRPHASPWKLARSAALFAAAQSRIPGGTLSLMKRPEHFAEGQFPVFLSEGRGALVTDVDGNEYIDFICGLGGNALGHADPAWLDAVSRVLNQGVLHSLPHELEAELASALIECVPGAEMARVFKTGADATSAAVRLARHLTGRERIVTVGYNGWHDHFMFDTPGVPRVLTELTTRMPLLAPEDDERLISLVEQRGEQLALVLLSIPYHRRLEREFLVELRSVCTKTGTLLVFDEIVTGFRLALGGAQEYFGVDPDYSCYSKAMTGGMPLSAVVGPRRCLAPMAGLQVSTTFGGELVSLASALQCIQQFRSEELVEHFARLGRRLRDGVNRVAEEVGSPLRVGGYDAIPFFCFDSDRGRHEQLMRPFQGAMAKRGVLLRRDVNFFCKAHAVEHIDHVVDATRAALRELGQA